MPIGVAACGRHGLNWPLRARGRVRRVDHPVHGRLSRSPDRPRPILGATRRYGCRVDAYLSHQMQLRSNMEDDDLSGSIQSRIETNDSPTVLSWVGRSLLFVACLALFPYGFFFVQAYRRTTTWPKAALNTGLLLLIHACGVFLILMPHDGYSSMARKAGFLLLSMNLWLGYNWQVRSMTTSNGYADWQRSLRWIGWVLKVLAIGTIILNIKG